MNSEHIESYLAGELSDAASRQVEHALERDAELRDRFLEQLQVDTALQFLIREESGVDFDQAVMARLEAEGAGEREFAKSVLTEIVEEREGVIPLQWPDLIKAGLISAAASIALMFVLQGVIFREAPNTGQADAAVANAPRFVARLEKSRDLQLAASTEEKTREDGWLKTGLFEIESGEALLAFNSGATATVEGPASLRIETNNRVFLYRGKLTADVPSAASGFTVNTERMNIVDIGTRFGISVLANGDSEVHVMEGEVEASRASGNSVAQRLREGLSLRADSRTRSELEPIPYAGDQFVMRLGERSVPQPALRYTFDGAGGNPVEDTGIERRFDVPLVASGELETSPKRGAGKFGGGLSLQKHRSLTVPLSKEFRLDSPYTIAFWVKVPPKPEEEKREILLSYGRKELGWQVSCDTGAESGSRGVLSIDIAGGRVTGTTDIADGHWHHVTCRFLGSEDPSLESHLHLFIDGRQETVRTVPAEALPEGRAGVLTVGDNSDRGLEGWIDELYMYREAVSTTTIQNLSKE
ncbi:MAG: FecR domain-containing protein [Verrucomicrobiales bacterium]|nr:FecR domain-containing protein [Verrucomicrobiales bacterium]